MKKRLLIVIACIFLLVASVFTYNTSKYFYKINHPTFDVIEIQSSLKHYPKNLSELEDLSQYIVKVKVLEGSQDIVKYTNKKGPHGISKTPYHGYRRTPVSIEKVYKAPDNFDSKTLTISEFSYEYTIPGKTIQVNHENYRPLTSRQHYILFLRLEEDTNDIYCVGAYQGKYIINEKTSELNNISSLTAEDMEVGDNTGSLYKDLLKEVMKKYK